jgi:FKBP-type peptidyl-prolyl cis-trans isomerase FkpA
MKQGFLIGGFVVAGALIIGLGSWYVNTNINNTSQAGTTGTADQSSNPQGASTNPISTSTAAMEGLQIKDTTVGTGTVAENGDEVTVSYVGKLDDGTVFDSSASHGQDFSFELGAQQVIAGWDAGVLGMRVGGTRELTIPPALGYGPSGSPPVIPPNATLHFTITLISVTNPAGQ